MRANPHARARSRRAHNLPATRASIERKAQG
jgi:hypothetical protein